MGQDTTKIKLLNANEQIYAKESGNIQRLIGDVAFMHDSTYLYCDSAHMQNDLSYFDGYQNVKILVNDSVTIFSDLIHYDTETKLAELTYNVRLVSTNSTLYTEELFYNRKTGIAYYLVGGKIVDIDNTLISKKGYYYTQGEYAFFKDSVVLTNPKYRVLSDTLRYDPNKELSNFYGPTYIYSKENTIYCENGWYNSLSDQAQFNENAYMINGNNIMRGDSLYYDRKKDFGEAIRNVSLMDTVENTLIEGERAQLYNTEGYAYITDRALASLIEEKDTLFLHADTLFIEFDSTQTAKLLTAYYKARFYRKDMQGYCDSLVYFLQDSVIRMYQEPVLWSEKNQLTADSINLIMSNQEMDSISMIKNAQIISLDDSINEFYNQIQGRIIIGDFKDNKLVKMKVKGNAKTIYFMRDDKDTSLIGINVSNAKYLNIYIQNNKLKGLTNYEKVDGKIYPYDKITKKEMRLSGFVWRQAIRPTSREDLFNDEKYKQKETALKEETLEEEDIHETNTSFK